MQSLMLKNRLPPSMNWFVSYLQYDILLIAMLQVNTTILGGNQVSRIDVKMLQKFLKFFTKTIVHHLQLYQSVFERDQDEIVQSTILAVQTPLTFPTLRSHSQPVDESPRYMDDEEFDQE